MKVTRDVVANFEADQEQFGTKIALQNVLWLTATDLLHDLGVQNIKTVWQDGSGGKGDRIERVKDARKRKAA